MLLMQDMSAGEVLRGAGRGERVAQRGQLLAELVLEGAQREVHAAGRPLARREHAARGGEARGEEVRAGQDVVGAVLHHEADHAGLLLGERGDLLIGAPHRGHRGAARELGLLDLDRQQQALGPQVFDEGDRGRALALEGRCRGSPDRPRR
jgi:hypothetical protein